jgi:hypothetical protein
MEPSLSRSPADICEKMDEFGIVAVVADEEGCGRGGGRRGDWVGGNDGATGGGGRVV